ncbi:Calx-beta domain-containing protein, partial [Leucobacter sp. M11]|uniref:Calx-beta domain-containing protein n=1 Tax=Leucobacter sp. M11 TaxID=2993565 RepID=UPI002D7EEA4A
MKRHRIRHSWVMLPVGALVLGLTWAGPGAWAQPEERSGCEPQPTLPEPGVTVGELFSVTRAEDDGAEGSLSWAIRQANDSLGVDTVEIQRDLDVRVTSELSIWEGVVLRAAGVAEGGRATLTVDTDNFAEVAPNAERDLFVFDGLHIQNVSDGDQTYGLSTSQLCLLGIRDTTFQNFSSYAVSAAISEGGQLVVQRSSFLDNGSEAGGSDDAAFVLEDEGTRGQYLVEDSVFRNNASGGFAVGEIYEASGEDSILISRSLFEGNGPGRWDNVGGALQVRGFYLTQPVSGSAPLLRVADSVFRDNAGGQTGGISVGHTESSGDGTSVIPELIDVSGSTFSGNRSTQAEAASEEGNPLAAHISVGGVERYGDGPAVGSALRVENSTFQGDSDESPEDGLPAIAVADGIGAVALSHSTVVGGGLSVHTGSSDERELLLEHSLIANGAADPVEIVSEQARVREAFMAYVVAPTAVPAASGRQVRPFGEYGLHALADAASAQHSLPMPVRVPGDGSPLVDAALGSALAVDQLGTARPQGPAADIGAVEVPVIAGQVALLEDVTVSEGEDAVFTVTRSAGSHVPASVTVSTADGSAVAGEDYTATSVRLSWAAGEEGPKTVSVPTLTDALIEPEQTFTVSLSEPSEGLALGEPS